MATGRSRPKHGVNTDGLVDIRNTCDGVCVQASYADYVNYPKTLNAKEAVAGFLWATAIVEKPVLAKKEHASNDKKP